MPSTATAAPIRFTTSGVEAASDGGTPILVAGEDAGATLPFGCRMGICHTCVGQLCSGQVRDLRTGEVSGQPGEMVRTCVNAPEGAVEIDPLNRQTGGPEWPRQQIESPLAQPDAPSRSRSSAREFDAIHDEVFADLGDRDRRYIASMIEMHRRLVVLEPGRCCSARATGPPGSPGPRRSRWPRSSRTWRSATT